MRQDVVWLHLGQVELLRAEDRAGSCDSDPADEGLGGDLEVLHCPETDQGASPSKACLAVDCDCAVVRLREVILNNIEKLIYDLVGRV